MTSAGAVRADERHASPPPEGPRRLLTACTASGAMSLAEHRTTYPTPHAAPRGDRHTVALVEASGLRGRGGAAFPTARKLAAVAQGRRRPVVVVNGSEGEPASGKDRLLLGRAPHLVLDGALAAAYAVRATEVIVAIERTSPAVVHAVEAAVAERRAMEPGGPSISVQGLPPRYVAGDESALVHWLNGGPAKPTLTPPRPFERGVGGRPTLVSNVETYAHIAQIVRWGPSWFRHQGTPDHPGTVLATVTGGVARPQVIEVAVGTSLIDVVRAAGGPTDGVQALLVGGYFGSWLTGTEAAGAELSNESLRPLGAALGCGAVTVLPKSACGLVETARILAWFANESAGQCGSCVHGLAAIAGGAADLERGGATDVAQLERWAAMVDGRGACHLPTGAVRFLRSALRAFAPDIALHRALRPCAGATAPPLLPAPIETGELVWR